MVKFDAGRITRGGFYIDVSPKDGAMRDTIFHIRCETGLTGKPYYLFGFAHQIGMGRFEILWKGKKKSKFLVQLFGG